MWNQSRWNQSRWMSATGILAMCAMIALIGARAVAAQEETITLASGAGLNPCEVDPSITYLSNSSCGDPLRGSAFTPQDFADARAGSQASAVNSYAGWLDPASFSYPGAHWIAVNCNRTPYSALYAIDFEVATECIASATLDFCFAADDRLGDDEGGINPEGLYLNGLAIPGTTAGGAHSETCWEGLDVSGLLQPGPNTLYVYNRDMGCIVSGVLFGATIHIQPDAPIYLGDALTSNRYNGMPNGTFQVVADYDGNSSASPTLDIAFRHVATGARTWVTLDIQSGIINTFEFDLCGNVPDCDVVVRGTVPNGVIDGLAFGFFWKDAQGHYHVRKSRGGPDASGSNFIGAWPRYYDDDTWETLTPQLGTCWACRHQARMTLYGAQLLPDGRYNLCCPAVLSSPVDYRRY